PRITFACGDAAMDQITSQVPANPPGMPGNPTQTSDAAPVVAAAAGGALMIVLIVIGVILGGMVLCGVGAGILMVAVQKAREASRRIECSNNMMQIGIACHNYNDTMEKFPTEAGPDAKSLYAQLASYMEYTNAPPNAPIKQYICPSRRNIVIAPGKRDYGY